MAPRRGTDQRLRWSAVVWSPPPESNRRPHPYHGSAAKRRANPCCRRSSSTVSGEVMCSVWTASESVIRVDEAVVPVARRFGRNSLHEAAPEDKHAHKCNTIIGSVKRVGGTVVGEQHPSAAALVLLRRPIARAARSSAARTRSWRRAQTPHRSAGASIARSCGPASRHVYPRSSAVPQHRSLEQRRGYVGPLARLSVRMAAASCRRSWVS